MIDKPKNINPAITWIAVIICCKSIKVLEGLFSGCKYCAINISGSIISSNICMPIAVKNKTIRKKNNDIETIALIFIF